MKKSKNYAPYLFAAFFTVFNTITNNLLFKPGVVFYWMVIFPTIVGLWYCVEWLLSRSERMFVRWGYVFLGSIFYIICVLALDHYVLHMALSFSGLKFVNALFRFFSIGVIATILMERVKWARAREKAKIENLTLQAENIETKFKLLREQVNPHFLFHCLTSLQTMVRKDDPKIEDYILKLADVYRQILKKQKNVISLREELAFLQSYMFLMRYGREKAISFEIIEISDVSLYYELPIFALQLLGDNCIKHNDFSESQPLHIYVFQKDEQSITMSHNSPPKTDPLPINMEHLEMRYALEGIENGVLVEQDASTYSTTIKLF